MAVALSVSRSSPSRPSSVTVKKCFAPIAPRSRPGIPRRRGQRIRAFPARGTLLCFRMSAPTSPRPDRTALVLAGGAARGAYEVGVVQHVLEEVGRDIGRPVQLDVLSG